MPRSPESNARVGLACGAGAFAWWGLAPLYFRALRHVMFWEVLAHRIVWSLAFLALLMTGLARWQGLRAAVARPKVLRTLAISTLLIACNWSIFIYAMSVDRVTEASFGYFITPLVNVALGVVFLGERLRAMQAVGIGLAAMGVAVLWSSGHGLPWIALFLAVSFGFYGLARKVVPIDSILGLFVETAALTPLALAFLAWRQVEGAAAFTANWSDGVLLAASGFITSVPLILFGVAARRLTLATIGILQYIGPSLQFLLAKLVFDEPLASAQLVSFLLIWTAVVFYSLDSVRVLRSRSAIVPTEPALANNGFAAQAAAQVELTPEA